ncbi:SH3 domain-containing protein [Pseudobowmanella zhangzhouensis]|uniref:SH3 domain-containing protein n=1 Tax=Pseudobowmanella zhangzhouensis TaxID=1537679 RepID=UPI00360C4D31
MRITRGWILCLWLFSLSGWAQDSDLSVTVDAEFIELRSGPARAYPVFHISKRGERLIVLARRTNWFRVETSDGIHGWISNEGIAMTRDEKGQALTFENGSFDAYRQRQFEVSVSAGVLEKSRPGRSVAPGCGMKISGVISVTARLSATFPKISYCCWACTTVPGETGVFSPIGACMQDDYARPREPIWCRKGPNNGILMWSGWD